jgi:hypothetical protein
MIRGRLAFLGGMMALAALGAAGAAAAQSASDLPPVSHSPFAETTTPAASDSSMQVPVVQGPMAEAHVAGVTRQSGLTGAWLVDASMHAARPSFGPSGPSAWSPPSSVLRDMPNGRADRGLAAPPVARYSVGAGSVFVLDRSTDVALLKFDDNPEIWVLQPTPAPRGDLIYKNDMGEPILRATRLGGLTLFSANAPGGEAAAMVGGADDLQPPTYMSPSSVFQHMLQASARASHAAQHLVTFDAAEVTPDSAPVFVDAATAASEAVITLSHRDDGRAFLKRLDKVQFQSGARTGAALAVADGGAHVRMQVFVDPGEGLAGRPSSERLVRTALGK